MEVIEGTAVEVPVEGNAGWQGDFPFYLVIEPRDQGNGNIGIDLDEPGWIERNKEVMRTPATWLLFMKQTGRPIFCLVVEDGDQAYFVRRHIGNLMVGSEIVAVGIGKRTPPVFEERPRRRGKVTTMIPVKVRDEVMVRLWLLPNGIVCGGDDVELVAGRMLGG